MNLPRSRSVRALSRLEVVIVVGLLTILAAGVLHPTGNKYRIARRIACCNNLKAIGLSFRLFASDNQDILPMRVSVTNGGTLELVSSGRVFPHFLALSNELATPKILVCPADEQKTVATNFSGLSDSNVSYFVGLDCQETNSLGWLLGDRNLTNRPAPGRPFLEITTNSVLGWSKAMHNQSGNICLSDGSVQQLTHSRLRAAIQGMGPGTNRLAIP